MPMPMPMPMPMSSTPRPARTAPLSVAALAAPAALAALVVVVVTGCPAAPAAEGEGEGEGEGDGACDLSCGPHARCDASRTGDAECVCLAGYEGDDCATCSYGYREDGDDCALCADEDEDGILAVDCGGRDCDDSDGRIPDSFGEGGIGDPSCFDGLDNDCSGAADADDPACTPPCSAGGWCLVREAFSGGLFEGTLIFAPDDAWVAGEAFIGGTGTVGGVIHHWDGVTFDTFELPDGQPRVQLLYGLAPDDIWAAGSGSVLFHWDGAQWTDRAALLPDGAAPYALYGAASDDVWGVTFNFGLIHWDGAAWTQVKAPDSDPNGFFIPQPSGITGCGADDMWMPVDRSLYRFDGAALTEWAGGGDVFSSSSPVSFAAGLAGGAAREVFAAGGPVFRDNGAAFERDVALGAPALDGIRAVAVSDADAWAAGDDGVVLRYDVATGAWEDASPPSSSSDFVAAFAPGDGTVILGTRGGGLSSWDGVSLTSRVSDSIINTLDHIQLLSPTEGFAVSANGTFSSRGAVFRLSGTSWSETGSNLGAHDVFAVSATDAWAVGDDSKVFRFDGSTWTQVPTGVLPNQAGEAYAAVSGTSSSDVWIAGTATVLHYDGAAFTIVPTSAPGGFNPRLFAAASDDVWLYWGQRMLHSQGGAFTDFGPSLYNYAVTCDGPDQLRIVGSGLQVEGAAFARFDGGAFTTTVDDGTLRVYDVAFTSDGAYAVGFDAETFETRIGFTRGDAWTTERPPGERTHTLNSVAADAAGDAIAAGSDGAIYVRVAP